MQPSAQGNPAPAPSRKGRALLLLLLLLVLLLSLYVFRNGDSVEDLAFDAAGLVLSLEEENGKVTAITCQLEGGEDVQRFILAARCRVVGASGKVSAHSLARKQVSLHFAKKNGQTGASLPPELDLIFVR